MIKNRRILLSVLTVLTSIGLFFALRDPWSVVGRYVDPYLSTLDERLKFEKKVSAAVRKASEKEYDILYVEAMLASQKHDYRLASIFFEHIYLLRPDDKTYYRDYAQALVHTDPQSVQLRALIAALMEEPERDIGLWILFGQFEETQGDMTAAKFYYDEALALTTPGTPLYDSIRSRIREHSPA